MIKRPRQHSEAHLKFLRGLSCCVCGDNTSTEAAHIRFGYPRAGKRATGMGEKPDDGWAVPLCGRCHREQHHIGEHEFWNTRLPNPIFIALALWKATGNHPVGQQIVRAAHD